MLKGIVRIGPIKSTKKRLQREQEGEESSEEKDDEEEEEKDDEGSTTRPADRSYKYRDRQKALNPPPNTQIDRRVPGPEKQPPFQPPLATSSSHPTTSHRSHDPEVYPPHPPPIAISVYLSNKTWDEILYSVNGYDREVVHCPGVPIRTIKNAVEGLIVIQQVCNQQDFKKS